MEQIIACGGLPQNNRLLMQIYADVLGEEICVADSEQTAALGAAIYAAVAAGESSGGYSALEEAVQRMTKLRSEPYRPNPASVRVYEQLYREYVSLHDYFGRGMNGVMKRLKAIKTETG